MMIDPGFEALPLRVHEWLKDHVENRPESWLYEQFATVEKAEAFPDPIESEEAESVGAVGLFPCLSVVYGGWEIGSLVDSRSQERIHGSHTIELVLTRLVQQGDRIGLGIRSLLAKTARLFLQSTMLYPPDDPSDPTDKTKSLWRPEDVQSTGLSLYEMFAASVEPGDPLYLGPGVQMEIGTIKIIARGSSKPL